MASANVKQVDASREQYAGDGVKGKSILDVNCRAHRWATIHTKVYDLTKHDISGLLNIAIRQRSAGQFDVLRTLVANELLANLSIERNARIVMYMFKIRLKFEEHRIHRINISRM